MTRQLVLNINQNYYSALSRFFSPKVLDSIVETGASPFLTEVCKKSGLVDQLPLSTSFGSFLDLVHKFLFRNYRNEYIYKNAIANKILLGKHSLNTAQMLTEFRAGKCKADVVILNGSSTVYEIKSEYDSFKRLEKQISEYLKVFDQIYVITSDHQIKELTQLLPSQIGILSLTRGNTIKTIRESFSNLQNIKADIMFNSLRKSEYINVIQDHFGFVPDVPNTQLFKECKKLYCNIPIETANKLTVQALKNRTHNSILKRYIKIIPSSLTAYVLGKYSTQYKLERFTSLLGMRLDHFLS
ncbi:MAG: sce7726 family protein [Deltaproteobacteria bacterium]|jgi:hypothetical protein|nr:sce7726 family protein [Deltaproteobacteria bacterium]